MKSLLALRLGLLHGPSFLQVISLLIATFLLVWLKWKPFLTGYFFGWTWHPENGEAIQILHYEHGQKYEPHFDYFHDKVNQELGGHRVATVLMYLSDVQKGGETVFPSSENVVLVSPFLHLLILFSWVPRISFLSRTSRQKNCSQKVMIGLNVLKRAILVCKNYFLPCQHQMQTHYFWMFI